MTGYHPRRIQVAPNLRQLLFAHPKQVNALTTSHFHRRDLVLVHNIGDRSQLS